MNAEEGKIVIYDKTEDRFFINDDGEKLLFDSETEAKNYLFGLEFTYEFVKASIEFISHPKHQ